jgi:glycine/D-amino acid oxidase-like deaminating enzyme
VNKTYETIIIGSGAAGLGCARHLDGNGRKFLMITENIGGRILSSDDGQINYGAYFVMKNFRHILPFVSKGERLKRFDVEFHSAFDSEKTRSYQLSKAYKHPVQVARLLYILYNFYREYRKFKFLCETRSQKEVIEADEDLLRIYRQNAADYVEEKRIAELAREFLSQGIYMCTFQPLHRVSAFDFLRLCLALILPAWEFTFRKEKTIRGFEENIVYDKVARIERKEVHTEKGSTYKARNIVVATPPLEAKRLVGIPHLKTGSNAWVFHVAGQLKDQWKDGQFALFDLDSPVIFIREQKDGSVIFYSKSPQPELDLYMEEPRIIFRKQWDPAFHITGDDLLEFDRGRGLYLAGDHNVIGLEDAWITGIFAANKIMENVGVGPVSRPRAVPA